LEPFPLLRFNFLIVLPKTFTDTRLTHSDLITEALHLPVIKPIQDLESKLDPPGGISLPLRGPCGCARKPRRTPISRPVASLCDLDSVFLIASRERLSILVSGSDQIRS